jgi:hypothetical protein
MEKSKKELQQWVPSGIGKCHEILLHCCSQDVASHPNPGETQHQDIFKVHAFSVLVVHPFINRWQPYAHVSF